MIVKKADRVSWLAVAMVLMAQSHIYAQQGPQFTQFMFNNLAINPAYAGAEEALSLTAISRSQWTGVDKAPTTQGFSAHSLFLKRVGLGLTVIDDRIGVHQNLSAMVSYAYHLPVGRRSYLSMGLQGGVARLKSDYPSLGGTGNDPKLANRINVTKPDIGAGVYFRSPVLDLGVSLMGLLSRSVYFNDTQSANLRNGDLLMYARYRINVSHTLVFEPATLVKVYYGLPVSYEVNGSLIYKSVLTTGVSYRRNDSIDLIIKLQLTRTLQFGYAYDYPVGNTALMNSVSHELMLHYLMRKAHKNVASPR